MPANKHHAKHQASNEATGWLVAESVKMMMMTTTAPAVEAVAGGLQVRQRPAAWLGGVRWGWVVRV
jgi:hypothetical protein